MLKFSFDPQKPYRVVVYLRMSSKKQNDRSPEQQLAEIKKRLKALGYAWVIVKIYRDDAKSGRLLRKRPGYQQMLQDIKTGAVVVDLILVDNIERFGRVEELPMIRKELFDHFGILVLNADTGFCDPTTPQGKAIGTLEAWRATDANRIKALEVMRGKRDLALQKFWPGGDPPFGLRLRSLTEECKGQVKIIGSVLEPDPETSWIIALQFQTAYERGYGQTRLTHFLNAHPDIPSKFKKFHAATVGDRLMNSLYKGVLSWNELSTGIIDDVRVVHENPPEELLVIPDFCPPIVAPEIWDAVNQLRRARADVLAAAQSKGKVDEKQLAVPARGLTLRYLLTGLVRCGRCGLAMNPSSSPIYVTKAGIKRRYVQYVCPRYLARICPNQIRVPEDWLRKIVIDTLQQRLFPPPKSK